MDRGDSPYVVGPPLDPTSPFFFGRHDLVDKLVSDSREARIVQLHGPRRCGKTTVLLRVCRRLQQRGIPAAFIDAVSPDVRTIDAVERRIVVSLERQFPELAPLSFATARSILQREPVLILDEAEVLELEAPEFLDDLYAETSNARWRLVASVGRTVGRHRSRRHVARFAHSYDIEPFELRTVEQAVRVPSAEILEWTDGAIDRIHRLSGGLPLLVNSLARTLWQSVPHAVIDAKDVDGIADEAMKLSRESLNYVWQQGTRQRRCVGWLIAIGLGAECEETLPVIDLIDLARGRGIGHEAVIEALRAFEDNWLVRERAGGVAAVQPLFWRFVRELGDEDATSQEPLPNREALARANRAAEAGQWDVVREHVDTVLAEAPQDQASMLLRARSMWHSGKREGAIVQLRALTETVRNDEARELLRDWLAQEAMNALAADPERAAALLAESRAYDGNLECALPLEAFIAVAKASYATHLRDHAASSWEGLTHDAFKDCPRHHAGRLAAALGEVAVKHFDAAARGVVDWLAGSAPLLIEHLPLLSTKQATLLAAAELIDDPAVAQLLRQAAGSPSLHAEELLGWALGHLARAKRPERALAGLAGTRLGKGDARLVALVTRVLGRLDTLCSDLEPLVRAVIDMDAPGPARELESAIELIAQQARNDERAFVLAAVLALPEAVRAREPAKWRQLALACADHADPGALGPEQLAKLRAFVGKDLPERWLDEDAQETPKDSLSRDQLQQLIGSRFVIDDARPSAYRVGGAVEPSIALYQGRENEERVSIRVFDLKGLPSAQRRFLEELWANEQRSLYGVGLRTSGRALVRLRHAVGGAQTQDRIIAVTDDLTGSTLRDVLDGDRSLLSDRHAVWRSLAALYESLRALHEAGCMHRAVRPESIFIVDEKAQIGDEFLRLGGFEFSIYLTSLARRRPPGTRWADRYSLPAAVHARLGETSAGGEYLAGDLYGLALVSFELLIRPLTRKELARCFVATDYREDEHRRWLASLRAEVDAKRVRAEITFKEALVFKSLLDQALEGSSNLDEVILLARECAALAALGGRRQELFVVTTTTQPGSKGAFADFVLEDLGEELADEKAVIEFLRNDLRGARVYSNADPAWKLLIEGRRLTYRAGPFVDHSAKHDHVAFLQVARRYLPPRDAPLAKLDSVEPFPYNRLKQNIAAATGSSWRPLFDAASSQGVTEADARRQLGLLRLTLDLESDVWSRDVYAYCDLEKLESVGHEDRVRLREVSDPSSQSRSRLPLSHALRQLVDREGARVDLSRSSDPTASFHHGSAWTIEKIDNDHVVLRRAARPEARQPPQHGYVRPLSLAGSRALYQRRSAFLEKLAEDEFLLRTIANPQEGFSLGLSDPRPIQERLDEDKRGLARLARNQRPLVLVQGPPGTGKTTLATEVILEALRDGSAARILVTAQSHEPLNNMLVRVNQVAHATPDVPPPLTVRLTRQDRLDASRSGDEAARIERDFSPGEIARVALQRATEWSGKGFPLAFGDAYRARVGALAKEPTRAVSDRVVAAANIVYATTNDRAIFEFQRDSFDLVIVEEAARALPLELLAPMSLGRRWLLIGDQNQLPPFSLSEFHKALGARIDAYEASAGKGQRPRAPSLGRAQPAVRGNAPGVPKLPDGLLGFENSDRLGSSVREMLTMFGTLHARAVLDQRSPAAGALSVQWRMNPKIGSLLKMFYPDLTTVDQEQPHWHHSLIGPGAIEQHSLVWVDMPHCSTNGRFREMPASGGGFTNREEILAIGELMRRLVRRSTGRRLAPYFLTPYRAQLLLFKKLSESWTYSATDAITPNHAMTVDSFQGRQASAIVLSLVRNNEDGAMGFLDSEKRATVAFSRAESLLIIVGCSEQLERTNGSDGTIRRAYEHIKEHGLVLPYYDLLATPRRFGQRS